jgi:hypothetical protein
VDCFERFNKDKAEAAVVVLYCCSKTNEKRKDKRRRVQKRQNKWRGSDVVAV